MKTALIITIGSRDLQLPKDQFIRLFGEGDYTPLLDRRQNPYSRKMADYLLDEPSRFDKAKEHLLFPIIKPCLDKLKSEGQIPERIILVVTDQPEEVGDFHFGDTVSSGQLLSKLLATKYKIQTGAFKTFPVKENVNFLDSMYAFFESSSTRSPFNELRSFDNVLLLNQGGIDAINFGLLFSAIKVYGKTLTQLCVDERTETCYKIGFVQQSLAQSERQKAKAFCERFAYSALETLELDTAIGTIGRYAAARLHFDFDAARTYLKELMAPQYRTFVTGQIAQLSQVQEDDMALLKELYINAKIHYLQAAYVDFLLRFFRIIEELARASAIKYIGLTEYNNENWKKDINDRLARPEFAQLASYLTIQKVNGNELKYESGTITTFQAINRFYKDPKTEFIDKIIPLSQLRNKSIGAHDFQPVSKYLIEGKLASKNITMQHVFEELDKYLQVSENPFDQINQQILTLLA